MAGIRAQGFLIVLSCLVSVGCSDNDSTPQSSSSTGKLRTSAPTVAVSESRPGTVYRQEIEVADLGETLVAQVFEPTELKPGQSYPLILHSHGYGGSRNTQANDFIQRLNDNGYYVISFDQRGFGESGGQVRVQSPEHEAHHLIALLDWAENLEGLARRANGDMLVGSYGSSYGGMFQMLMYIADPKHRLRVLAPDIIPHDLNYSLGPHGVPKSGWGMGLLAAGEAPVSLIGLARGSVDPEEIISGLQSTLGREGNRQDPALYEILLNGATTGTYGTAGSSFFEYHSVKYYCDGLPAGPQDFQFATPDDLTMPPVLPPPADILFTQGFLDTMFNFNDGVGNYECMKALGGDVRLLTHQSGHILPLSFDTIGLEDPLDPFYQAITLPEFQDGGGSRHCGSLVLNDVQFAWFEEKLKGKSGAVNKALPTGKEICLSLAEDDAVTVRQVKRGGSAFAIDSSTPQFSSAPGGISAFLGNEAREALLATQSLMTVGSEGGVIGGIPTLDVEIAGLSGMESDECPAPELQVGCDPIFFLAIGHRPAGQERFEPLDGQITPVRGFGHHVIEMNGIAERLHEGDELALLIYGYHFQFLFSASRDVFVPAANFSGSLELPLLSRKEIRHDGI